MIQIRLDVKAKVACRGAVGHAKNGKTLIADDLLVGVPSGLSMADAHALAGETLAVA